MADTFVAQRIHLIWSTRKRHRWLTADVRGRLWAYVGGIIRHYRGVLLVAGGIEDHIHLYADLPKTISLSRFVNVIKSNSSRWLREEFAELGAFGWQSGYAGFSVEKRNDAALQDYIRNQEQHHERMTFQDEYVRLLRRNRMAYDPRHVFD